MSYAYAKDICENALKVIEYLKLNWSLGKYLRMSHEAMKKMHIQILRSLNEGEGFVGFPPVMLETVSALRREFYLTH